MVVKFTVLQVRSYSLTIFPCLSNPNHIRTHFLQVLISFEKNLTYLTHFWLTHYIKTPTLYLCSKSLVGSFASVFSTLHSIAPQHGFLLLLQSTFG
ncbi:hypothetical protein PHAVU_007G063400 [Phaseolus vulgaris]|uniref:Uncharacterized protein n=1 Tax=Phaseolus vulgaris TaxID=3885 RepID=V7BBX3_PHAVU|nr:hypothetical protein PHAVU_007G063400g [Phaseolus vulgaris]ESW15324.1 hypothetical protein PHAVU_007G063400g [Phaseolus vulgaris]